MPYPKVLLEPEYLLHRLYYKLTETEKVELIRDRDSMLLAWHVRLLKEVDEVLGDMPSEENSYIQQLRIEIKAALKEAK
jgi:hypothetical protein